MAVNVDRDVLKTRRMRAWYNALPTVLWSVICLYPVGYYSYRYLSLQQLYIFIGISFLFGFLPKKWLDRLSFSKQQSIYKRLKVHWVNAVTQNGTWVNSRMRRYQSNYQSLKPGAHQIKTLIAQTYMYERFHLILIVYFLLIAVTAFMAGQYGWALGLLVANIIYNVYPNLLQQYIRLRLKRYLQFKGA